MPSMIPQRVQAVVDLAAVERNVRTLRSHLQKDTEFCAVVKANGYGHGAVACAHAAGRAGATWFAVASAGEALALREGGISGRILILSALTAVELGQAIQANADLVAWTPEFVTAAAKAARAANTHLGIHVEFDTGMGRFGTVDAEGTRYLASLIADSSGLNLVGLMTHFATAFELDDDYFPSQLDRFTRAASVLKALYPGLQVHAANSAAMYRTMDAHFDFVRCGAAIYGLDPFGENPAERGLEPALSLESYVASVKRFDSGQSAGYGRLWRASRQTMVGVIPIGYGDGWRRPFVDNAEVLVQGRRHPIVGMVAMDHITVDLGPDADIRPGEPAVLIGRQGDDRILLEDVARRIGTVNYEVATALSERVPRLYSSADLSG